MRHIKKTCRHCKSYYFYQASGHGCHDELNNEQYCPECMKVINKSLRKVKERFSYKLIDCLEEIDKWNEAISKREEESARWQKENFSEEPKTESEAYLRLRLPTMRRIIPNLLYSVEDSEKNDHQCQDSVKIGKNWYFKEWWSKDPENFTLKKEVRWDNKRKCIAEEQ